MAPEQQHRYYCQLCLSHYVFPRLWEREEYPIRYLPGERTFAYNPYFVITLQYFFLCLYAHCFPDTSANALLTDMDTETPLSMYQLYFNMLLGITSVYGVYLGIRFWKVRNKMLYVAYMYIPMTVHQPVITITLAILIISLAKMLLFPLGIAYVVLLSRVLREHDSIIKQMNADAYNIALM